MKLKLMFLGTIMLTLIALISCSDEVARDPKPIAPEEDIFTEVSLVIKANTRENKTRAGETYPHEGDESVILNNKIKLYVYNANGALEYINEDLTLDAQKSVKIKLKTGEKYFYVSANTNNSDNNDAKNIGMADLNTAYEQQTINVSFDISSNVPDLTKPNFILSTLWREKKEITIGITEPIQLKIGRIVAKVKLTSVTKNDDYSVMKGKFENPQYSIGAVPTKCYWVGQYNHQNWSLLPPPGDTNGEYGTVTSAVHTALPTISGSQNPLFYNYSLFMNVTSINIPMTEAFYIIENTTGKDGFSQQYYGNTTYIRLKTVYEPIEAEIYNAALTLSNQTLQDKTFWTVIRNGVRYITNAVPANDIKDEGTEIKEYKNGENFHRFAIKDTGQTEVEKRHSVYRNHFYDISVTGIRDLGEPTDIVDPSEPIPTEEIVTTSVTVIDWSKITQEEEI